MFGYSSFMEKKIEVLSRLMKTGAWEKAIKYAAKFPRLGNERGAILSAAAAMLSPHSYKGMGKDPDVLFKEAVTALKKKYPNHC